MRALAVLAAAVVSAIVPARTATRAVTVAVISETTSATRHALTPKPGTPADRAAYLRIVEVDRLYNGMPQLGRPAGARVGSDRAVVLHYRSGRESMTGVATILGSKLRFAGTLRIDLRTGEGLVPVTGGTGRYAGCRGTVGITDSTTVAGAALNVYRLTCPGPFA